MGIVQNSCITLMKGFDPLQMLTTVVSTNIKEHNSFQHDNNQKCFFF